MTDPHTADALKARIDETVEQSAEALVALSEDVRRHPELGFGETYTASRVARWLDEHAVGYRSGLARTGIKAVLDGRTAGPSVAVLAELDAVHVPTHSDADPATGAAHACGHEASLAAACGAVAALARVLPELDGRVVFMAVPAEELLPSDRLDALRADGQVTRATGKAELLRLGELDDVDMALMVHAGRESGPRFSVGDTLNGAVAVSARFEGTAAHGGSSPWLGVDAAQAARLAVTALEAQRATFPETDGVRLALQLRQPEAALGAVPAHCRLDILVRARSLAALEAAVAKVDRACYAGAVALGAGLTRTCELMYPPHASSSALDDLVASNAIRVVDGEHARGRHLGASSDIGDLSLLMPVSHPYASGAVGHHHSPSFRIKDHRQSVLEPAKYLAMTVVDLLVDGAAGARRVIEASAPEMSRAAYEEMRTRLHSTRNTWTPLGEEPG